MTIYNTLYNAIFKRSSTFAVAIILGSFALEGIIDVSSNAIFENINKGKLWKDIKDNYEAK